MGIVGQNYWKLFAEFSSPELLNSEYDFTRIMLMVDFRIPTFLRRRLLPNTLDIHLIAGTHRGEPVSRSRISRPVLETGDGREGRPRRGRLQANPTRVKNMLDSSESTIFVRFLLNCWVYDSWRREISDSFYMGQLPKPGFLTKLCKP